MIASDDTSSADATSGDSKTASGSTVAGVDVAQWADNVAITINDDGTFRYESDGLLSHELPDQFLVPNDGNMPPFDGDDIAAEFYVADTADLIVESPIDVEITLNPVYSEETTQTDLSTIGVMISGAALFNDYEDQTREFVALDDNLSLEYTDLDHLLPGQDESVIRVAILETVEGGITFGEPASAHGNHDVASTWWNVTPEQDSVPMSTGLDPIIVYDAAANDDSIVYATNEGLSIGTTTRTDLIESRAIRFVAG